MITRVDLYHRWLKWLSMTLVVAMWSACQRAEQTPQVSTDKDLAYIGVTVNVRGAAAANGLRDVTDKQENEAGTASEQTVHDGLIFFKEYPGLKVTFTPGATGVYETGLLTVYPKNEVQFTLLINNPYELLFTKDYVKARTIGLSDLLKVTTDATGMLMTSTIEKSNNTQNIDPKATEEEVRRGDKNHFAFEVERVVAKLQVTKKSNLEMKIPNVATLQPSLSYSMAGSARESYLFTDQAGKRELSTVEDKHIYDDYASIINGKAVPEDWDSSKPHPFLQRVSDKEGNDYILNGYFRNPKEVTSATDTPTSIDEGFYFLENSMYEGGQTATKKGEIKYNRIAYAKVYVQIKEIEGWKLTDNNRKIEKGKWGTETENRYCNVYVPAEFYNKYKFDPRFRGRFGMMGLAGGPLRPALEYRDKPRTFYMSMDDGEIFDSPLAAYIFYGTYPKNLRKYEDGKMVYLLPMNAQRDAANGFINYCDTRRNNIYDLRIDRITGVGRNYDPVDPDDPNIPKPWDNPFEPPVDPQIPVEPADYAMQITGKVLKWNKVVKNFVLRK